MSAFFTESLFFGVVISILGYELGGFLKRKCKLAIFNPLLLAVVFVIAVLAVFRVDYDVYYEGAKYLSYLLTPATVCLAIPLYQQLDLLKKNWKAILLAALAGVFLAANLRSSAPTIGDPFTLKIVAACALGGTSLAGGKGGVTNTIVGVLIMTVLDNGLLVLGVNPNIRTGIQGVIILVSVILTVARGAKVISK